MSLWWSDATLVKALAVWELQMQCSMSFKAGQQQCIQMINGTRQPEPLELNFRLPDISWFAASMILLVRGSLRLCWDSWYLNCDRTKIRWERWSHSFNSKMHLNLKAVSNLFAKLLMAQYPAYNEKWNWKHCLCNRTIQSHLRSPSLSRIGWNPAHTSKR